MTGAMSIGAASGALCPESTGSLSGLSLAVAPSLLREFQNHTRATNCRTIDNVAVCAAPAPQDRQSVKW